MKYLLLLLLLVSISAIGQNCLFSLSGHVIDLHDQTALKQTSIIIAGTEQQYITDDNGYFNIKNLCDGIYTLQVSHPACTTQIVKVHVHKNTVENINLEHHLEALNEVNLTSQTHKFTTKKSQLSAIELQKTANQSLGDALKAFSGVSSLNSGNTIVKPVIQGLHSSRIMVINKGTRLQDQEWGVEHAPNIDINDAGSISIEKGASSLQYGGDAIAGAIVIKPEKIPLSDSLYGHTILTGATNGRGGTLTTKLTKSYNNGWYAGLQGTYKNFGDFNAPDYVLSNTAYNEQDFSLKIGVNKYAYGIEANYSRYATNLGILRASHVGSSSDLFNAITANRPLFIKPFSYTIDAPRQETIHQTARLKLYKRFEDYGKISFQYNYQKNNRLEFDRRRDSEDNRPSIDLELISHSITADYAVTIADDFKLKTGISANHQTNFPDPDTGLRRLIPDYTRNDLGAYFTVNTQLDKWFFDAGMRYDYNYINAKKFYRNTFWESRGYDVQFNNLIVEQLNTQLLANPVFNFHNASASLGAKYTFNTVWDIAANVSFTSRAPNPSELFSDGLHQSASRFEIGDIRFNQERGFKTELTLSRKHKHWSFTAVPYINYIYDFILIEPTGNQQTQRGNFPVWEYRQADSRIYGLDIDNSINFNDHWAFTNQFSILKGHELKNNTPIINMPAASTRNRLTYNNQKWNHFSFWIENQYVFEQNEFPNTNFDVFIPELDATRTLDVSTPPPAYTLFNASTSMTFDLQKRINAIKIALHATNIFNTRYRDYLNRFRYYADNLGQNLTLQIQFNY